tara:strand:- start:82 stop:432 length:351 start_codon:yes stop_codon:yes gene_type:complete
MIFISIKIIVTAIIIVVVSEIAKVNDKIGGLIAAMPLTTFLILFWMNYENSSVSKISNHMIYTLMYLIPTIPMFLIFPFCLNKFGFWISILISIFITILSVLIVHQFSKNFDFKLF